MYRELARFPPRLTYSRHSSTGKGTDVDPAVAFALHLLPFAPMSSGLAAYAEIALPVAVHGTFTYAIPPELRDGVRLGSRVEVPLGTKRTTGFVVALADTAPPATKIKPVRALLDDEEPALIPEIIELCRWAAEYYLAPLGEMLRMALPANMAARGRREVRLSDGSGPMLDADRALVDMLRLKPLPFEAALEISTRA